MTEIEEEIDGLVQKIWKLDDDEMQDIKDSLREQGGTVSYEDEEEDE